MDFFDMMRVGITKKDAFSCLVLVPLRGLVFEGLAAMLSSAALAGQLLGHDTRPSEAAIRAEMKIRVQDGLNSMDPLDREVLALRHFEQLSRAEIAQVLGISEGRRRQAVHPGPGTAQTDPGALTRWTGRTAAMSEASSGFDPVDDLVEAFLERYRRGERPSLTEYTDKHPELAERIRTLFPALLVMEELGPGDGQATGP